MTVIVSSTGKPSSNKGKRGLKGAFPWVSLREKVIAMKPRSWLPASPMNTVAGYVLNLRKPKIAPTVAADNKAIPKFPAE